MYLVFDVGGTFIKYALMDQKGKIYEKYKVPTPFQDGKVDDNGDEITPYTVKTEDGIAAFLEQIDIIYGKYSKEYQIDQHKNSAAVLPDDIRKLPHISDSNCTAGA